MFEFEDMEDGYLVDMANVVKDKNSLAVTRMLASDLLKNPYLLVGDWIGNITDSDLQALLTGAETNDEGDFNLDDILLLAMMLRQAEGLPPMKTMDECREAVGQFIMMLAGESLARKGLVRIYRENLSFGADMGDKVIMEKI